jgi:cytochrome b
MSSISGDSKILVWDVPVRVFHWLMVLCFAGAYITSEGERWRLVHVTLGYTMAGLVGFRVLWGLMGTRYARFSNFVRGPARVAGYLRSLLGGAPEHYTGHNPAGAVAIVLLLLCAVLISLTGWASYNEMGGEWLSELHEGAGNAMLALVGVHLAGVAVSTLLHGENLVRAMVTGTKVGDAIDAVRSPHWWVALGLVMAVVVFWVLQWQGAPAP